MIVCDHDLIEYALKKEESAWRELQHRYRASVQNFCRRFFDNSDEAEDATQETFILAWRRLETFRGASCFKTWLFVIAKRQCLNRLQRGAREQPLPGEDQGFGMPDPQPTLEERVIVQAMVKAVLERLDNTDRLIFFLTYQMQMTSEEVAFQLAPGISISAEGVRARLHRHIRPAIQEIQKDFVQK